MLSETRPPNMRAVRWGAASRYSPWPDRLVGRAPWTKARRTREAVLEEYDRGCYQGTLLAWRQFVAARLPCARLERGALLEFEAAEFARIASSLSGNQDVYGASAAASALVSVGEELFLTAREEAIRMHYGTVLAQISRVAASARCDALVELGCGSGVNLVRALCRGIVDDAFGGDLSPSARILLEEIAAATHLRLRSFPGDLCAPSNLDDLPLAGRCWLLLTVHAVEQLDEGASDLVDGVLRLRNRPRRVLHLEPIAPDTESRFDDACRSYTSINRYNSDLLQVLKAREAAGEIRIVDLRRRLFGAQAFNPTSLIEWEPI